jgi:hypothetical protein
MVIRGKFLLLCELRVLMVRVVQPALEPGQLEPTEKQTMGSFFA